jgi:hypothetical protein
MIPVAVLKKFILLRSSDGSPIRLGDTSDEQFSVKLSAGNYILNTEKLGTLHVSENAEVQQTDFDLNSVTVLDGMPVTVTNFSDFQLEVVV